MGRSEKRCLYKRGDVGSYTEFGKKRGGRLSLVDWITVKRTVLGCLKREPLSGRRGGREGGNTGDEWAGERDRVQ